MQNMLDRIITHKRKEVENAKANLPLSEIESQARMAAAPRGFMNAIKATLRNGEPALIAEIKKASPSKGLIREDFDPAHLAQAYEQGGATCLSVLTDVPFFQGHPIYLKEVRTVSSLPALRKDFMIDPYQVVEARAWGADCILVIMAAVDDPTAHSLTNLAKKWGMDVLVEVHNRQELERALKLNTVLIGINNRNLQTFDIKLEVTEGLAPLIPKDRIIISESGIFNPQDLERLQHVGVHTYLVGESLMRHEHVENATRHLLGKELVSETATPPTGQDDLPTEHATNDPVVVQDSLVDEAGHGDSEPHGDTLDEPADLTKDDDFQNAVQELGALIGSDVRAHSGEDTPTTKNNDIRESDIDEQASDEMMQKASRDPHHETTRLSHVNEAGEAHMVDISGKNISERVAVAEGFVAMKAETLASIQQNTMKKGDVLATARIAAIMAAKNTSDLIPLCHPLAITSVEVQFLPTSQAETGIRVEARVKVNGQTGVEMEALTAVSVACLTIYDMAKAVDKGISFSDIRLLEKTGGKSGHYQAVGAAE